MINYKYMCTLKLKICTSLLIIIIIKAKKGVSELKKKDRNEKLIKQYLLKLIVNHSFTNW